MFATPNFSAAGDFKNEVHLLEKNETDQRALWYLQVSKTVDLLQANYRLLGNLSTDLRSFPEMLPDRRMLNGEVWIKIRVSLGSRTVQGCPDGLEASSSGEGGPLQFEAASTTSSSSLTTSSSSLTTSRTITSITTTSTTTSTSTTKELPCVWVLKSPLAKKPCRQPRQHCGRSWSSGSMTECYEDETYLENGKLVMGAQRCRQRSFEDGDWTDWNEPGSGAQFENGDWTDWNEPGSGAQSRRLSCTATAGVSVEVNSSLPVLQGVQEGQEIWFTLIIQSESVDADGKVANSMLKKESTLHVTFQGCTEYDYDAGYCREQWNFLGETVPYKPGETWKGETHNGELICEEAAGSSESFAIITIRKDLPLIAGEKVKLGTLSRFIRASGYMMKVSLKLSENSVESLAPRCGGVSGFGDGSNNVLVQSTSITFSSTRTSTTSTPTSTSSSTSLTSTSLSSISSSSTSSSTVTTSSSTTVPVLELCCEAPEDACEGIRIIDDARCPAGYNSDMSIDEVLNRFTDNTKTIKEKTIECCVSGRCGERKWCLHPASWCLDVGSECNWGTCGPGAECKEAKCWETCYHTETECADRIPRNTSSPWLCDYSGLPGGRPSCETTNSQCDGRGESYTCPWIPAPRPLAVPSPPSTSTPSPNPSPVPSPPITPTPSPMPLPVPRSPSIPTPTPMPLPMPSSPSTPIPSMPLPVLSPPSTPTPFPMPLPAPTPSRSSSPIPSMPFPALTPAPSPLLSNNTTEEESGSIRARCALVLAAIVGFSDQILC
eukprot:TRINITY_DN240_c0_g1_i2.p1 TRINITY_DN240_c0_g1~~TRINITY_DN240_c0_g1_i2.p1  ORF type:complete len:895 (+),score=74.54 TRINITY_DN240_c0_g1_i2:363-2687(+)